MYYHEICDKHDDVLWCQEPSLLLSVDVFRKSIDYLKEAYAIVSLDEIVSSPSPRSLAITFDDGYRGNYTNAFPVLKAMGLPATIFLVTDYVDSAKLFWWDDLALKLKQFASIPLGERVKCIHRLGEKWRPFLADEFSSEGVLTAYETAVPGERADLRGFLDLTIGPSRPYRKRIFLSTEEIREMMRAGISFGAHTRSHPLLSWLDDAAARDELWGSKERVAELTGERNSWFSYPDGAFSNRERKMVEELGFFGAVQTARRPNDTDRFALARVPIKEHGTVGMRGSFSRAMMEVMLAGFNTNRIKTLFRQLISGLARA